jgi:hypothetical protein
MSPGRYGHIIILLILVILVLVILVLVILDLVILPVVCLQHRLCVLQLLFRLLLLLLVAIAIIGDCKSHHYFQNLDIDPATGIVLVQPRLALCRPSSVFILVVYL